VTKDATKFGTIFSYAYLLPTFNHFAAHLQPLLIIELCMMNYHTKHHTNYNNVNNINNNININNLQNLAPSLGRPLQKEKQKNVQSITKYYNISI
jgi:hypothetical protein